MNCAFDAEPSRITKFLDFSKKGMTEAECVTSVIITDIYIIINAREGNNDANVVNH